MMMPANFSAVAENEMTYVIGGGIVDVLAPVLTEADWQRFNTNLVTIIGNTYLSKFVDNTLGVIFSGTYSPANGVFASFGKGIKDIWNANAYDAGFSRYSTVGKGVLNVGLYLVGNAAAIYNLATASVKNLAGRDESWNVKTV
ncbi:MAG: hypothetical protein MR373_05945 [Faecalibacterium prausnitzii]|nr:hypothetical protein [Faecalibacterium prausnitzii]